MVVFYIYKNQFFNGLCDKIEMFLKELLINSIMKRILLIFVLIFALPPASALGFVREGSMKLLAISEENNTIKGSLADLHLEIRDGSGKVFIETFPFTKLDTQITTRFAKQIACAYLNTNCNNYDFFYTIKADSSIIGGPSAGAATTVLTVALLGDLKLEEGVTVTGTINSGNIIGSVGGLKEKIDTASFGGIKKVLIPKGEKIIIEKNQTIDLESYAAAKGIILVEVSNIDEVLYEFTGSRLKKVESEFMVSDEYTKTMKLIAEQLCEKANDALASILNINYASGKIFSNESLKIEEEANNLIKKARLAYNEGRYYTSASFCYGANVKYLQISLIERNTTKNELRDYLKAIKKELLDFEKTLSEKRISTITDLEAYMIVKERLSEAKEYINQTAELIKEENMSNAILFAANAEARFYSAKLWSGFFGKSGMTIEIDNDALKKSCKEKISEAEERYQYVGLYYPEALPGIKDIIRQAYSDSEKNEFALCLFRASEAKAEADIVLSSMNVESGKIDLLIDQKIDAAKRVIAAQAAKGLFPIFGYSYYEYASSLKNESKSSALLYAEYAIELSNLDMYFKQKEGLKIEINWKMIAIFFSGFVFGVLVYEFIYLLKRRKKKRRKHRF